MRGMKALSDFDYAELRVENGTETSVRVINNEVKTNSGKYKGISVRVLENGSWGFAASNTDTSISELLKKAEKLAKLESGKISVKKTKKIKRTVKDKIVSSKQEEIVGKLLEARKHMEGKEIISKSLACSDSVVEKEFYNSEGVEIHQKIGYTYLSCSDIARSGALVQRGSETEASRDGFGKIDVFHAAEVAKEKAERLLRAELAPKGVFTVVLDPEMTGVLSHEAIGHASEADSIVDRESILANKMGKKIGSELVNIVDDPTAKNFGLLRYDEEGVKARKTNLITKGVVSGFLNSRETAKELGVKSNGHARAASYDSVPIVRMTNTYFLPGKTSVEDVFDIRKGIYLKGMRGGSVDTFSGGFMFKAEEAQEIKNGECGAILRDVTISGNILETLKHVVLVGKDFGTSPGMCGKMGQEAPVSDGGPHIQVKKMKIG